jgi:hypothetical protein
MSESEVKANISDYWIQDSYLPYKISNLKYFYIKDRKKYAFYYKTASNYEFRTKGFVDVELIKKIEKKIEAKLRSERIQKVLGNV